jgi:hypothetical protein
MFQSMLAFFVVALLVSWAMGAYNRMVRLRAAAIQALAVLQSLRQQLDQVLDELAYSDRATTDRLRIEAEYQLQNDVCEVAMKQYNEAIVQIPASWLATLFAFKPIKKK